VLRHETAAQRESWAPTGRQLPRATADILGLPAPRVLAATTVVLNASSYAAFRDIADGETVTLRTALTAAPRTATWNAVGRLRGSDPTGVSEAIVLSAHLDHEGARATPDGSTTADVIYNGADDDASGVAAVLELARPWSRAARRAERWCLRSSAARRPAGTGRATSPTARWCH